MSFYQGSVAEAVASSRAGFKPLIVLLKGLDEAGAAAEHNLLSQSGAEHMAGSILLRLEDDLNSSDPLQFTDAKHFRAFCPTDQLPTVAMVSPSGATLAQCKGAAQLGDAAELHAALAAAFQQVKQQQQAVLAAQAFAALAQRAQQAQQAQQQQQQQQQGQPAGPGLAGQPAAASGFAAPQAAAATAPSAADHPDPMEAEVAAEGLSAPVPAAPAAVEVEPAQQAQEDQQAPMAIEPAQTEPQAPEQPHSQPETQTQVQQAEAAGAEVEEVPQPEAAAQPEAAPQQYCLHLRFTDSTLLQLEELQGNTTLGEVFAAIDAHRASAAAAAAAPGSRVPYVLVQPYPRRSFVPAEEGSSLQELGIQPRTTLAVVPNPAGHQPPPPPPMPAPVPVPEVTAPAADLEAAAPVDVPGARGAAEGQESAAQQEQPGGAAPSSAEGGAASTAGSAYIGKVALQIRLTNGDMLRGEFDAQATMLGDIYDYIDANRTDGSARYLLTTPYPKRTFYSGDISMPLGELGLGSRAALQLEHRPPAGSSGSSRAAPPRVVAAAGEAVPVAAKPAAAAPVPGSSAAAPAPAAASAAALPATFTLQFKQPDGGVLRGDFEPDSTLQQIFHYIDSHRTDGGGAYTLVQPYPKRRFGSAAGAQPSEMSQSLLQLGLGPRSLLIMEPAGGSTGSSTGAGGSGGGWSLGGLMSYLNPLSYLKPQYEPNMRVGEEMRAQQQQEQQKQQEPPAETLGAAGEGEHSLGGTRKRGFGQTRGGGGGGANVHTLGRDSSPHGGRHRGDGNGENVYWNGNSTEFGGDDDRRDA